MYFQKCRLRIIWRDNYLKGRVSDDPYTDNKENDSRHCRNLNDSTFTKFIKRSKGSCIGKSLF